MLERFNIWYKLIIFLKPYCLNNLGTSNTFGLTKYLSFISNKTNHSLLKTRYSQKPGDMEFSRFIETFAYRYITKNRHLALKACIIGTYFSQHSKISRFSFLIYQNIENEWDFSPCLSSAALGYNGVDLYTQEFQEIDFLILWNLLRTSWLGEMGCRFTASNRGNLREIRH